MKLNSKAYLTIDDSPSGRMDDLVDYLEGKGIPAVFFCRGDNLESNMSSAIRALQKGFLLANHTYSHKRSSEQDYDWLVTDIERCEKLLDHAHAAANVPARGKYFRFPHVDRGTAAWIVDYDRCDPQSRAAIMNEVAGGVNFTSMERPPASSFEKRDRIQDYLKNADYTNPFKGVTHEWYNKGEISEACDSLFTFSNCDWMLNRRQSGKWPYKTIEDLKNRARQNPWLAVEGGVNLILAHDQTEIVDITIELLDDMLENGIKFIEV